MKALLFIVCLSLLLTGCFSQNTNLIKPDEYGGTSLGLSYFKANNNQLVHMIDLKQEYKPKITLINHLTKKQTYRLFFLLDYKQIEILKGDKKLSYVDVKLGPEEQETFEISILEDELLEGHHDFIAISIRSPEYFLEDNRFITGDQFFMYRRVSLQVGESKKKPDVKYLSLQGQPIRLQYVQPILTKGKKLSNFQQASTLLNATEDLNVNINIENRALFGIIALSSKGEVPIENKFYKVYSAGQVTFPLKINTNNLEKPYNLYIISFSEPFGDQTKSEARVHSSNLITIRE